jgi:hypothetical protein
VPESVSVAEAQCAFVAVSRVTQLKSDGLAGGVLPQVEIEMIVLKPSPQSPLAILPNRADFA